MLIAVVIIAMAFITIAWTMPWNMWLALPAGLGQLIAIIVVWPDLPTAIFGIGTAVFYLIVGVMSAADEAHR